MKDGKQSHDLRLGRWVSGRSIMENLPLENQMEVLIDGDFVVVRKLLSKERILLASGAKALRSLCIEGRKFGELTAKFTMTSVGRDPIWKCQCSCGKEVDVLLSTILTNTKLSCSGPGHRCRSRYSRICFIRKDLSGLEIGHLKVIKPIGKLRGMIFYECLCRCGNITDVASGNILRGSTVSCGCISRAQSSKALKLTGGRKTHGLSKHPLYATWKDMRKRCFNKHSTHYSSYGGRGISVCERWSKFTNFLEDMGDRPPGMSLDRKDVNGNYEPSNCRWATTDMQARNKQDSVIVTFSGITAPLLDHCDRLGVDPRAIRARLSLGWTVEKALTEPVRTFGNRESRLYKHRGKTMVPGAWAREYSMNPDIVYQRLSRGWTIGEALEGRSR